MTTNYKCIDVSVQHCVQCFMHPELHEETQKQFLYMASESTSKSIQQNNGCKKVVLIQVQNCISMRKYLSQELEPSRLGEGTLPKIYDVFTVLTALFAKDPYGLNRIRNNFEKTGTVSLHSYLKMLSPTIRLALKFAFTKISQLQTSNSWYPMLETPQCPPRIPELPPRSLTARSKTGKQLSSQRNSLRGNSLRKIMSNEQQKKYYLNESKKQYSNQSKKPYSNQQKQYLNEQKKQLKNGQKNDEQNYHNVISVSNSLNGKLSKKMQLELSKKYSQKLMKKTNNFNINTNNAITINTNKNKNDHCKGNKNLNKKVNIHFDGLRNSQGECQNQQLKPIVIVPKSSKRSKKILRTQPSSDDLLPSDKNVPIPKSARALPPQPPQKSLEKGGSSRSLKRGSWKDRGEGRGSKGSKGNKGRDKMGREWVLGSGEDGDVLGDQESSVELMELSEQEGKQISVETQWTEQHLKQRRQQEGFIFTSNIPKLYLQMNIKLTESSQPEEKGNRCSFQFREDGKGKEDGKEGEKKEQGEQGEQVEDEGIFGIGTLKEIGLMKEEFRVSIFDVGSDGTSEKNLSGQGKNQQIKDFNKNHNVNTLIQQQIDPNDTTPYFTPKFLSKSLQNHNQAPFESKDKQQLKKEQIVSLNKQKQSQKPPKQEQTQKNNQSPSKDANENDGILTQKQQIQNKNSKKQNEKVQGKNQQQKQNQNSEQICNDKQQNQNSNNKYTQTQNQKGQKQRNSQNIMKKQNEQIYSKTQKMENQQKQDVNVHKDEKYQIIQITETSIKNCQELSKLLENIFMDFPFLQKQVFPKISLSQPPKWIEHFFKQQKSNFKTKVTPKLFFKQKSQFIEIPTIFEAKNAHLCLSSWSLLLSHILMQKILSKTLKNALTAPKTPSNSSKRVQNPLPISQNTLDYILHPISGCPLMRIEVTNLKRVKKVMYSYLGGDSKVQGDQRDQGGKGGQGGQGEKGDKGDEGKKEDQGEKGDQGGKGSQGDKGGQREGIQGDQGDQGNGGSGGVYKVEQRNKEERKDRDKISEENSWKDQREDKGILQDHTEKDKRKYSKDSQRIFQRDHRDSRESVNFSKGIVLGGKDGLFSQYCKIIGFQKDDNDFLKSLIKYCENGKDVKEESYQEFVLKYLYIYIWHLTPETKHQFIEISWSQSLPKTNKIIFQTSGMHCFVQVTHVIQPNFINDIEMSMTIHEMNEDNGEPMEIGMIQKKGNFVIQVPPTPHKIILLFSLPSLPSSKGFGTRVHLLGGGVKGSKRG